MLLTNIHLGNDQTTNIIIDENTISYTDIMPIYHTTLLHFTPLYSIWNSIYNFCCSILYNLNILHATAPPLIRTYNINRYNYAIQRLTTHSEIKGCIVGSYRHGEINKGVFVIRNPSWFQRVILGNKFVELRTDWTPHDRILFGW